MEAEKKQKAPKKNWTKGLQAEFKKIVWPDKQTLVKQTVAVVSITAVLGGFHCCYRQRDSAAAELNY